MNQIVLLEVFNSNTEGWQNHSGKIFKLSKSVKDSIKSLKKTFSLNAIHKVNFADFIERIVGYCNELIFIHVIRISV